MCSVTCTCTPGRAWTLKWTADSSYLTVTSLHCFEFTLTSLSALPCPVDAQQTLRLWFLLEVIGQSEHLTKSLNVVSILQKRQGNALDHTVIVDKIGTPLSAFPCQREPVTLHDILLSDENIRSDDEIRDGYTSGQRGLRDDSTLTSPSRPRANCTSPSRSLPA